MRYFLAPRSGEKSYSNFQSSIKNGVPFYRIAPHLASKGREILAKQEVIYAWGNREGKKAEWELMEIGDTVIFYAHYNFVMAGKLIYKQNNSDLALAMWPPDENNHPWSYTFFLDKLEYFKIPLEYFNLISGYHFKSVQGFQQIREESVNKIIAKYGSFDNLFKQFEDEYSIELPRLDEPININVNEQIKPEFIADFRLKPFIPKETVSKANNKKIHIDFEERHKKNSKTGSLGEEIVLKNEKDYLTKIGKKDLADKVERVSLDDMSAGYDILSFDSNGNKKLIEVKTTVLPKGKEFSFNISSNEKKIAENSNNYYIYLVFDVNKLSPKIVTIKNPFTLGMLHIEPTQFIVKGAVE